MEAVDVRLEPEEFIAAGHDGFDDLATALEAAGLQPQL